MERCHGVRDRADELPARAPQPKASSAQLLLRLQGTAGNRAVATLVAAGPPGVMRRMRGTGRTLPGPVIQRTPADAAQALRTAGFVKLTKKEFSTWLRQKEGKGTEAKKNADVYGVTEGDLAEVQKLIGELKEQAAAGAKIEAARARLATAQGEAPGVQIVHNGVIVNLDTDQLKHQPPGYPIGTRPAKAGATWPAALKPNAAWHRVNTLPIIGEWAAALNMQDGEDVPTKQSVALSDGNFYEGFCVQLDGQKYVFFHCYPPRK